MGVSLRAWQVVSALAMTKAPASPAPQRSCPMKAIPLPRARPGVAATSWTKSLHVPKPAVVAVAGLLKRMIVPVRLKPTKTSPLGERAIPLGRPAGGFRVTVLSVGKEHPLWPPLKRLPVILPPMPKRFPKSSDPCPLSAPGRKPIRKMPCDEFCSSTKYRKLLMGSKAIGPPVTDEPLILKGHWLMLMLNVDGARGLARSCAMPVSISGSTRQSPKLVSPTQKWRHWRPVAGLIPEP